MLESYFNKATGLYPAISLKGSTPTQVLSGEFCEILKTPFLQNICSVEKIFYQQNSEGPSEKRKKIKTACKKSNHTS